jgi:hypothetical protein
MTAPSPEHRSRQGWLGRPVNWRLSGATLSMTDEGGGGRSFALPDIRELRLSLTPSRFSEHYVCELRLADGGTLSIYDEYQRFVVWKVSSKETYRGFVLALCAALASEGRRCRFRAGPRVGSHLLIVLAMAVAIYLIAQFLVVHVGMSATERNWFFAFGCGLILLKSPYWRRSNRQAVFDPADIPEELLPPEAGTRS